MEKYYKFAGLLLLLKIRPRALVPQTLGSYLASQILRGKKKKNKHELPQLCITSACVHSTVRCHTGANFHV